MVKKPKTKKPKPYPVVWSRMVPGLAITLQLTADNFLNSKFVSSDRSNEAVQCHGRNELIWRTVTFFIIFFIGFVFMKKFDEHRLFHGVISFGLVAGWLFAVSDFPLTCWINTNQPLSMIQSQNVSITRGFITLLVNGILALFEKYPKKIKPIVGFFDRIENFFHGKYSTVVVNGVTNVNGSSGNGVTNGDVSEETA